MSRKSKENRIGFTKVDKVLRTVIKGLENPQKLQEICLFELWEKIADPKLKKHAAPERLFGKTLFIKVSEPVWAHEFTLNYRAGLLAAYQNEVGPENLEDIRFHAGRFSS